MGWYGGVLGTISSPSCLCLLVIGIHALGCSSAIYLSFGVNTSLPCRDRSVMAFFPLYNHAIDYMLQYLD